MFLKCLETKEVLTKSITFSMTSGMKNKFLFSFRVFMIKQPGAETMSRISCKSEIHISVADPERVRGV